MQPLEITVQAAGTEEELCSNIRSALARGLPELTLAPTKHDGNMVLVASGWSMKNVRKKLRKRLEKTKETSSIRAKI